MQKPLRNTYDNIKEKETQYGEKEVTYVFGVQEETMFKELAPKIRTGVWQIFPSVCASLTCIPYGLMLGWPSPTYPKLLAPNTPVHITLGQTAMVAGFLMLGICFGTVFSSKHIGLGPKYGIILGNMFILLGWIVMWQAQDVYGLLASRFLLGSGHGYAMGQIKSYIQEMTEDALSITLTKHVHFYGAFGFLLAYVIGPFVDFRQYSLISLIISVFILFLAIFLPSTPRELIRGKKFQEAKRLLLFLKPDQCPDQEIYTIVQKMSNRTESKGFMKIMRDSSLRVNFVKLSILLVCQQYCGAPPTLVYTQILFVKSGVPYSEYIALVYAVLFLISTFIGTYVIPRYNKRTVLLISSYAVFVLYICKILVIYYRVNDEYFSYSSVIVMYLFIVVHTVGLGSIPFTLINDWFPKEYRVFVTKYFIVVFSLLALTITKIFQVLMVQFPLYIPFCLFMGIIVFGIIFITFFIHSQENIYRIDQTKNCTEIEKRNKTITT